jgi:hypothetical protein
MCSTECSSRHFELHSVECKTLGVLYETGGFNDPEEVNKKEADWERWQKTPNLLYSSVGVIRDLPNKNDKILPSALDP